MMSAATALRRAARGGAAARAGGGAGGAAARRVRRQRQRRRRQRRRGGGALGFGVGWAPPRLIRPAGPGVRVGHGPIGRFAGFLNSYAQKKTKGILNGLQKSRNKFSPTSKIKLDNMNIYLGPKCNFEKRAFFLNSNKTAEKLQNKILFDFFIKSSIFIYFGKVILFPLSYFCNRNN